MDDARRINLMFQALGIKPRVFIIDYRDKQGNDYHISTNSIIESID